MEISSKEIEVIEGKMLNELGVFFKQNYRQFLNLSNQVSRKDFITHQAGQGDGRAQWPEYDVEELIESYPQLEDKMKMELEMRLASLDVYGEGLEKFLSYQIVEFFKDKEFNFKPWITPNAADTAFLIENFYENRNVILHIDAKTITGYKNIGDGCKNSKIGKHQLKWNQTSYRPELLRDSLLKKGNYLQKKYKTLDNFRTVGGEEYLTVTLFLVNIAYLPPEVLEDHQFEDISVEGDTLKNIAYIGCVPNGVLESDYYDQFFDRGKSGYDSDVPKDARINYITKQGTPMKFQNLDEEISRAKLISPEIDISSTIQVVEGDDSNYNIREVELIDFENKVNLE